MKKSTLIMILSLVLAVALGVGSTMAYLQDTDEDVNVMTLGNVDIEQHEFERAVDEEGKYETIYAEERGENGYKLTDFTQAKPLYPATGEVTGWDDMGVCFEQLDGNKLGKMTVLDGLNNVQDKFVFVENTGKSDAYVRTIIAYEVGSDEDAYGDLIMTNTNTFWLEKEIGVVKIDGNNYYVVEYLYDGNQYPEGEKETIVNGNGKHPDGIVHPGEYTYNSLAQIYLKGKATNEDIEAIDGNKNGTYDILVVSQAVQAQGFADAKTALDTAFGVISKDSHPWMSEEDGGQPPYAEEPAFPVNASDADEMMAGLANGADIIADKDLDGELIYVADGDIELDAQGATVQLNGSDAILDTGKIAYSYLGFVPPIGESATIKNLNVTGTGFVEVGDYEEYGNQKNYKGEYIIENVTIKDLVATYHVNMGAENTPVAPAFGHYGKTAVMNDCVMTGTTSLIDGYTPVDVAFPNATSTTINRGEYGRLFLSNQAKVTINDAKVGIIDSGAITTSNLGKLTIGAGTTVDTINLIPGTYPPALVIDKDATVGQIIYNGTTYTQDQWMAR